MSLDAQELCYLEALYDEFDNRFNDDYELQNLHMEYIMENCHGERMICNGDMLIEASEEGYLYEAFRDDYIEKHFGAN